MSILLKRLKAVQPDMPELLSSEAKQWKFSEALSQQDVDFYLPLVRQWRTLNLEYNVIKAQLSWSLRQETQHPDSLKKQLLIALAYAEILDKVNGLVHIPQAQNRLQEEQAIYRRQLRKMGVEFPWVPESTKPSKPPYEHTAQRWLELSFKNLLTYTGGYIPFYRYAKDIADGHSVSDVIRNFTSETNWPRLLVVRIRRVFDALSLVLKHIQAFKECMAWVDKLSNPIFAYLAWLFYIPRFSINLYNLLINTIAHPWMDEEQRTLPWQLRLEVQWQRFWFELMNDGVWMAVGLTNCFVLVGALSPFAIYLTVMLYLFDVILAGIRAYIEMQHFAKARRDYHAMLDTEDELTEYQHFLDAQIRYEQKRLYLSVGTTVALLVGMCLSLPFVALNPAIPLVGAVFIVATCILTYQLGKYLEQNKPALDIAFELDEKTLLRSESSMFFSKPIKPRDARPMSCAPSSDQLKDLSFMSPQNV